MPWQEVNTVDLRKEFVLLVLSGSASMSELCRRFSISRKTGYKWLNRYNTTGTQGLQDRAKTPHHQPKHTPGPIESLILATREQYPVWGGRKLKRFLEDRGHTGIPAPSTITSILRRHGHLTRHCPPPAPYRRFQHPYPNDLWQMDFKGHISVARSRCHPLTILDDCSRYSLCLKACPNERTETVKAGLIQTFTRYGLPSRMTMDNGSPWGSGGGSGRYSTLTVWLIEHGVAVSYSRPYHPQTQGKDERFHRTLKAELLGRQHFRSLQSCQDKFDQWRIEYNTLRPHESLNLNTPVSHYELSQRRYKPRQPPYEYSAIDQVRKVAQDQTVSFKGFRVPVGQAFIGKQVAFRPTSTDGVYKIYFCHQRIGQIDLKQLQQA